MGARCGGEYFCAYTLERIAEDTLASHYAIQFGTGLTNLNQASLTLGAALARIASSSWWQHHVVQAPLRPLHASKSVPDPSRWRVSGAEPCQPQAKRQSEREVEGRRCTGEKPPCLEHVDQ